jgi:cell division protein FtsQ
VTGEPGARPIPLRPRPGARPVSRLPARLYAARRRSRERWRRLAVTVTVAVALLATAGYLVVWHTPLFAVGTVRVVGARAVPGAQIAAASGIRPGAAMASVDAAAAVRRVEGIARIASAEVALSWPHTVVVTVVERAPAALIPAGGGYQIVDRSGVIFGTAAAPVGGLPVIRISAAPAVRERVVPGALAALRALSGPLAARVTGIAASGVYDITLTLSGGITVFWGDGAEPARKAADLAAMMRRGPAQRFDVSAPNSPAMS